MLGVSLGFLARVTLSPMMRGRTDSILHHGGFFLVVSILVITLADAPTSLAQSAQSYRQQATELARSKSWDEAIAAYRKALEIEPNDALTHYDLALALHFKGDTKQSVEEFESAIRLKPDGATLTMVWVPLSTTSMIRPPR